MKDRRIGGKPACAAASAPVPTEITCPHCKAKIEVWSDETETVCTMCSSSIVNLSPGLH